MLCVEIRFWHLPYEKQKMKDYVTFENNIIHFCLFCRTGALLFKYSSHSFYGLKQYFMHPGTYFYAGMRKLQQTIVKFTFAKNNSLTTVQLQK